MADELCPCTYWGIKFGEYGFNSIVEGHHPLCDGTGKHRNIITAPSYLLDIEKEKEGGACMNRLYKIMRMLQKGGYGKIGVISDPAYAGEVVRYLKNTKELNLNVLLTKKEVYIEDSVFMFYNINTPHHLRGAMFDAAIICSARPTEEIVSLATFAMASSEDRVMLLV